MKYMRVNYVDAEPMKFGEFKAKFPTSGGANLTRPDDDEGYVITYRKGQPNEYVSWCPAAEFDAVSTPVPEGGMSFGMAIYACRYSGRKIQRRTGTASASTLNTASARPSTRRGLTNTASALCFTSSTARLARLAFRLAGLRRRQTSRLATGLLSTSKENWHE